MYYFFLISYTLFALCLRGAFFYRILICMLMYHIPFSLILFPYHTNSYYLWMQHLFTVNVAFMLGPQNWPMDKSIFLLTL